MATTSHVILYRYAQSPYAKKVENILLLKGVPYSQVNVASTIPRPDIKDILGIGYRRIPILAIGRDIYCDTSLIARVLERRFPPSLQHSTIFPKAKHSGHVDTGLATAFSQQAETAVFPLAGSLLPWDKFPESFIQDRSSYFSGSAIDGKSFVKSRAKNISTLTSHLQLLEDQLSDGREWLLNTDQPGLVDISYQFILSWVQHFPTAQGIITQENFPRVTDWLTRFSKVLGDKRRTYPTPGEITGTAAAKMILSSDYDSLDFIGFDHLEASRVGVEKNQMVQIAPTDTGTKHPTLGNLVAFGRLEMVIEVVGAEGTVRCHFPRLNFSVRPVERSHL